MKLFYVAVIACAVLAAGCARTLNPVMTLNPIGLQCKNNNDCDYGYYCRPKAGGGTECGNVPGFTQVFSGHPPTFGRDECKNNNDCDYKYTCESKAGGGTECRAEGASNIQQTSTPQAKTAEQSPKTMPSPIKVQPIEQPIQSKSAIEEAKETCASLGFKSKTEKFGNCVLKLTK